MIPSNPFLSWQCSGEKQREIRVSILKFLLCLPRGCSLMDHSSKGHPSDYFAVHRGKLQHRRKSCSLLSIVHFLTDCQELGNVCILHHCLSLDNSITGSSWKALWWTQDLRVRAKNAMWSLLLLSLQFSSLFFFVCHLGKISRPTHQYLSFSTVKGVVESVISRLTPWARWWSSGRVPAGQVWGPASNHLHRCKSQKFLGLIASHCG